MATRHRVSRTSFKILSVLLVLAGLSTTAFAFAQMDPPIPSGDIRVHYFRPDGKYTGWTVYAYGDTTEPNRLSGWTDYDHRLRCIRSLLRYRRDRDRPECWAHPAQWPHEGPWWY